MIEHVKEHSGVQKHYNTMVRILLDADATSNLSNDLKKKAPAIAGDNCLACCLSNVPIRDTTRGEGGTREQPKEAQRWWQGQPCQTRRSGIRPTREEANVNTHTSTPKEDICFIICAIMKLFFIDTVNGEFARFICWVGVESSRLVLGGCIYHTSFLNYATLIRSGMLSVWWSCSLEQPSSQGS